MNSLEELDAAGLLGTMAHQSFPSTPIVDSFLASASASFTADEDEDDEEEEEEDERGEDMIADGRSRAVISSRPPPYVMDTLTSSCIHAKRRRELEGRETYQL